MNHIFRQCMDVYDEKCETKYPAKCVEDQSCTMIYQTKCESSGYNQKCQQVPVQQCTPITKVKITFSKILVKFSKRGTELFPLNLVKLIQKPMFKKKISL